MNLLLAVIYISLAAMAAGSTGLWFGAVIAAGILVAVVDVVRTIIRSVHA